ncbi:ABC transporter ATP-binding protein [Candidatus Saccharibacteria bacterium]|jgi:ABC-2 type transport system ATP-binding protein|uniref:Vitamin B12 import ATP-binding protein BtuD n=1 Tax=Candidatus Southlakia epibionticum TaxID=3043284 RepID=A0ABY8X1N0_9BACT|nr:ABC transporter ATP-binding protein [Candidatus Saccharibacteria bacterium]WIO46488.1 Vitamin B12 import ATP-binding protein BtuD [Candidatus Saccharimonadaceae bacterium ML1]
MPQSCSDAIVVKNLKKSFSIPLEASSGIKQKLINALKGRKGYREFTPLDSISFTVKKGEFYGIVGKNGSGKSTLLKTLAGIYSPQAGSVATKGTLVPFIELGVGFNPELSGRENVYLNGALLGFSHAEVDTMYEEIVEFAELEDFMEERLKNYSSGMQVRLAFSIAIKAHGDILLLDEVLAVGDAAFQQKCYDYFETLRQEKQTVVLVTHDMNAVKRFCSKAMIISEGKIEKIGTPEEIAEIYTEKNIEQKKETKKEKRKDLFEYEILDAKKAYSVGDTVSLRVRCPKLVSPAFVNFSLVYNGFVIADRNSKYNDKKDSLKQGKWFIFKTKLEGLNGGRYDVHLTLHRTRDNKLLEHKPRVFSFMVKGHDPSRDGPMRLEGQWSNQQVKE